MFLPISAMSDKSIRRQAVEGVFITSAGSVLAKILGLFATFFVLTHLTTYDYGLWRLLLSVVSFFGLISLGSISGILVADISRELGAGRSGAAQAILRRALGYFCLMGLFSAGALCIAAPVISSISGIGLTTMLLILAVTLLIGGLRQAMQVAFQARLEPTYAQVMDLIGAVGYIVLLVIFLGVFDYGILGLVLAYTLSTTFGTLALLPFLFRPRDAQKAVEADQVYSFKEAMWRRGKWAFAEDYVQTAASSAWPWIVGYFLSISQVGIISIAVVLVGQVTALVPVQYVLRSILPRFTADRERIGEWLIRAMRYALWGQVLVGVGVLIIAYVVFPSFFPSYLAALPLYLLLLVAIPFRSGTSVLTEWYYARKAQKAFFMVNAISKLSFIFLPFLLVWLGLSGFAVWFLIDSVLSYGISLWYVTTREELSYKLHHLVLPDSADGLFIRDGMRFVKSKFRS